MLYVGIDWADQTHTAVALNDAGSKLGTIEVAHTPQGLARLDDWLTTLLGSQDREQMACIIETSRGLLIAFLLGHDWPTYPVNPRTVDRKRSASGAKTDAIDAYLLAKTGRADFADLHRLQPEREVVAELKLLTRDQDSLIQMRTRLVNQLTACLKEYYPVALDLFTKLQQRSTLLFLQQYPTLEQARSASREQISQFLKQVGHTRAESAASTIVTQLHQPQLSARETTARAKSRFMLALVAQLLPLLEQIATYDKEIERLFLSHQDVALFKSVPRAGKHLAPRLLAEVGEDASRYASAASLQALAGTAPVVYQSGTYSKAHLRRGCIKALRTVLYRCAWQSTLQEPWAREYYQRKRAQGKSHSVAVRALSNVWARILFAMLTTHTPYDRAAFQAARQRHAPRAT